VVGGTQSEKIAVYCAYSINSDKPPTLLKPTTIKLIMKQSRDVRIREFIVAPRWKLQYSLCVYSMPYSRLYWQT